MNELTSHREQLHNEMNSNSERGIYDELPKTLIKLSQTVDNVMAEIGEENEDVFFARTDHKSKSGANIALLTQGPKYHQYDVTTHLDITGWAATHPERSICRFVDGIHSDKFTELLTATVDRKALELAAVLHDIEKPFKPRRRVSMEHPWDVNTRVPGEVTLLSESDLVLVDGVESIETNEFRQKFAQLLCVGRENLPESRLNKFNGLLKVDYDTKKVLQYLQTYFEFDKIIIDANTNKITNVEEIKLHLDGFIAQHSTEEIAVSSYIVLTDKFAQGVPPENEKSKYFEDQHERTTKICNYLIGKITQPKTKK